MFSSNKKPFVVVDGSSYLFRAYYALPALTNSDGLATGAVYGVLNMLQKLINEFEPERMVVVFDPKGKTTRHEFYPDYKANRASMPDELAQQIPYLHKAIKALGLPLVIEQGVEADDLIGTLTHRAVEDGWPVLISTGDKDMAQLVNDNVHLINTMKNQRLDSAGVEEKYGVSPAQVIDYLSLMGDTSDNIQGVRKVGPKTAVKWLKSYQSLDNIVANAKDFGGKVGENLRDAISTGVLPLARRLVTIDCDLNVSYQMNDFAINDLDTVSLKQLFKELEFTRWLRQLESDADAVEVSAAVNVSAEIVTDETVTEIEAVVPKNGYDTVLNLKQWRRWFKRLKKCKVFAFDTETTSLNAMEARLVGFSVAVGGGQAAYIPLAHDYPGAPAQCERATVLSELQEVLNDPEKICVGHNLKYDMHILRHEGITIKAKVWDTMIASYVLNSSTRGHKLETLAERWLDYSMISFEDLCGSGAKQLTFNQVKIEKAAFYAAEDADITLRLYQFFAPKCAESPVEKTLYEIDLPTMRVLEEMEYTGVRLDVELLKQQSVLLTTKLASLQKDIHEIAETEFNIASPKQLQMVLFDKMGLPILKKTPKGQPSTAEDVLAQLAQRFPLPKLVLEYRSAAKLKSTYTDKLPLQVNQHTGRVHTQYNQTVTSTGRLSSNNPNLQNIPVRHAEGRKIRQAFVAQPGRVIVAADYSQVELRIMAHLSQDPGLCEAFLQGKDVHAATAAEVFSTTVDEVTTEQRRRAKAINFGLMYGMSAFGLAKQLGIGRHDAQQYIDIYFDRYPKVLQYIDSARENARINGFVETLTGRRLHTPDINASNAIRRKAAERAAINAPLQGSAADIIKLAMIACLPWQQAMSDQVSLLMQVHDELVFSVKENVVDQVLSNIKQSMESCVSLSVPLLVDCGVGANWDEAH
jgi:DNA polymerase I